MAEQTTDVVERSATMPEQIEEPSQFLTFHVRGERFAIGILDVKEIIEIAAMTRVPMTPDFIRGVINLRGNVVAVVDLASRLGRGSSEISKRSCIVLVEIEAEEEQQTIGMLVDEVNEILEIPEGDMQPAPDFGTDIPTKFIQRMGRIDDAFIILLEVNHVLSVGDLSDLMQFREGQQLLTGSEAVTE
jgi:purine-binding chemotaxis protein CheW